MVDKLDANDILKAAKDRESDRKRVTLYLSEMAYEAFQGACAKEKVAASAVIEEFMKRFVEGRRKAR